MQTIKVVAWRADRGFSARPLADDSWMTGIDGECAQSQMIVF
jgi:hypothetical protein